VQALAECLARSCPDRGIDLAGAVVLPCRLPHTEAWLAWIASERHAGLEYLARDPVGRADPTRAFPWARSLLVFAQRYTNGWPAGDDPVGCGTGAKKPWIHGVARYARGLDYHDILARDVKAVLVDLAREIPELRTRVAVDTGPFLEREYAWLAGLGFFGKNSCLIHERLGSGLFLAVALTNLEIDGLPLAGEPAKEPLWATVSRTASRHTARVDSGITSRCGRCRRCLEACPTGALDAEYRLDARLCISTWTIEWRGGAPSTRRCAQGGWLFGCDICQAVCPWNQKAARTIPRLKSQLAWPEPRREYLVLTEHDEIDLADIIAMTPDDFRRRFRRTPLWRAHPEGLRRNGLIVAANTGRNELVKDISVAARTDPDRGVRHLARWARSQFKEEES
jgi:epoxyqueuosine reductase